MASRRAQGDVRQPEAAVVGRYLELWNQGEPDSMVGLLHEEFEYRPQSRDAWSPPGTLYRGRDGWRTLLKHVGVPETRYSHELRIETWGPRVVAAGTVCRVEPDGRRSEINVGLLFTVVDGRIRRLEGFRSKVEALAALSRVGKEDFELAFEAAPDAMALIDDQGRVIHANPAKARLLGVDQAALVGRAIADFAPEGQREPRPGPGLASPSCSLVRSLVDSEGELAREGELNAADGTTHRVELRARANYAPGRHVLVVRPIPASAGPPPASTAAAEERVLTPRQREIFTLLAQGLNGPEVAKRLFISPATVRTHVTNAMMALDSHTRAQAIAEALARGEISLDELRDD